MPEQAAPSVNPFLTDLHAAQGQPASNPFANDLRQAAQANVFDQFDPKPSQGSQPNPFDQFDPPSPPAYHYSLAQRLLGQSARALGDGSLGLLDTPTDIAKLVTGKNIWTPLTQSFDEDMDKAGVYKPTSTGGKIASGAISGLVSSALPAGRLAFAGRALMSALSGASATAAGAGASAAGLSPRNQLLAEIAGGLAPGGVSHLANVMADARALKNVTPAAAQHVPAVVGAIQARQASAINPMSWSQAASGYVNDTRQALSDAADTLKAGGYVTPDQHAIIKSTINDAASDTTGVPTAPGSGFDQIGQMASIPDGARQDVLNAIGHLDTASAAKTWGAGNGFLGRAGSVAGGAAGALLASHVPYIETAAELLGMSKGSKIGAALGNKLGGTAGGTLGAAQARSKYAGRVNQVTGQEPISDPVAALQDPSGIIQQARSKAAAQASQIAQGDPNNVLGPLATGGRSLTQAIFKDHFPAHPIPTTEEINGAIQDAAGDAENPFQAQATAAVSNGQNYSRELAHFLAGRVAANRGLARTYDPEATQAIDNAFTNGNATLAQAGGIPNAPGGISGQPVQNAYRYQQAAETYRNHGNQMVAQAASPAEATALSQVMAEPSAAGKQAIQDSFATANPGADLSRFTPQLMRGRP